MDTNDKRLAVHRIAKHFSGLELENLVVLRHEFSQWMQVDVQAGIFSLFAERPGHQFLGCRVTECGMDFRFPQLLEEGEGAIAVGPPVYSLRDMGDGELVQTLLRGLWLDEQQGVRYALLSETAASHWHSGFRVEIAVPPGDHEKQFARSVLDRLIADGERADTHRGRILTPGAEVSEEGAESFDLQRLPLTPVSTDDIILDRGVFELFERNTFGFLAQVDALSKLGFPAHKGLLLYGPPGTGKTLLVRYLLGMLEGHTRFVLTPDSFCFLAQIMEAARKMSPAVIVIEDVDLIAENREYSGPGESGLLNCLLNEMDGLTADARILFILTTNRPEVLEPALVSRPGRMDQAIEVDLPRDQERRLLLARFAHSIPVTEEVIAAVSRKAHDVSPAFLKELVRRSAQTMLEASAANLTFEYFEKAWHDMVEQSGEIGAQLIGAKGIGF